MRCGAVTEAQTKRSDGTWKRYTSGPSRYIASESWGLADLQLGTFTYERDPITNIITGLTLTCPDRTVRPFTHSSRVHGNEDYIKSDLLRTHCSWSAER
jgi:hypothetical protein